MIDFNEADARALRDDVITEAFAAYAPRLSISIADCAEQRRILPSSSSSEGGPFRNRRVPYLRGIMDALSNPRVPTVVVMKGAQVAGTTIGENWVLWTMLESPAPMLSVWPTEKLMRRWSLTRLDPMIEMTPELARLFDRTGLRDSNDAIAHKEFPGGTLDLLTARSSSDLRSITAARIWFSEVDNILAEIIDEGDPFELARSRGETYWDYKEYFESTPTVAGHSRIWDELTRTTWNDWWMPCPHCKEYQVLVWRDGMEDGDLDRAGERRFIWERDGAGEVIPGSVTYACSKNGCAIEEHWKTWMLERGEWRPRHPDRLAAGFHIPAFISPLISWTRIAQRFQRATRSQARMRTFVNNICGLPYAEKTRSLTAHFLKQREEDYGADVPDGVQVLVAGADVQSDRVEVCVWGYGAGEEAWVIEWGIINGEPGLARTWRDVSAFLRKGFVDVQGRTRHIAATCMDANYQSARVHRFAAAFVGPNGAKVIPIIGRDGRGRPVLADPPPPSKRRRTKRRRPSRVVGTDTVKDLLSDRLLVAKKSAPGVPAPEHVHFPTGLDPTFYEQLTAEELRTVYRKKRPVRVWEKKKQDLANEVLDMAVYAYAALVSLGTRIISDLAKLANQTESGEEAPPVKAAARPATKKAPRVYSKGVY